MTKKETPRKKGNASFDVYVNGAHISTIDMAAPLTAKRAVREAERAAKRQALMSLGHTLLFVSLGHTLLFVSLGYSLVATVKAIPERESHGGRWKVTMHTEMFDF